VADSSARKLPPIPQVFAIGGFKRDCRIECEDCHLEQVFTVYSDEPRDDQWCNDTLDEMLADEGWTMSSSGEYCERCSVVRYG
jgi:hypothetical protein